MTRYLLRRLAIAVPSLLGISLVLFTVLALAPGDPFQELASNQCAARGGLGIAPNSVKAALCRQLASPQRLGVSL
jgi:ABC-type dipeptide/oligopeptide/nickel transport system permease component